MTYFFIFWLFLESYVWFNCGVFTGREIVRVRIGELYVSLISGAIFAPFAYWCACCLISLCSTLYVQIHWWKPTS